MKHFVKPSREGPLSYWYVWQDGATVITQEGVVGQVGDQFEWEILENLERQALVEQLCQEKVTSGFVEMTSEMQSELALQYRIDGFGSPQDLDKRNEIIELLDEILVWTGNGNCDGGDIGSGTMNVFCFVSDVPSATQTILGKLEEYGYQAGVTIAVRNADDEYVVVYPEDGEYLI